jgi:hypothetical protein
VEECTYFWGVNTSWGINKDESKISLNQEDNQAPQPTYFYSCNNFGHKAIHCKSNRRDNPKNVQRSQKFNTNKRNYNFFSTLHDYNMECLKCKNFVNEYRECIFSKYVKEINIPNN